jgi:hypothetical protein
VDALCLDAVKGNMGLARVLKNVLTTYEKTALEPKDRAYGIYLSSDELSSILFKYGPFVTPQPMRFTLLFQFTPISTSNSVVGIKCFTAKGTASIPSGWFLVEYQ